MLLKVIRREKGKKLTRWDLDVSIENIGADGLERTKDSEIFRALNFVAEPAAMDGMDKNGARCKVCR